MQDAQAKLQLEMFNMLKAGAIVPLTCEVKERTDGKGDYARVVFRTTTVPVMKASRVMDADNAEFIMIGQPMPGKIVVANVKERTWEATEDGKTVTRSNRGKAKIVVFEHETLEEAARRSKETLIAAPLHGFDAPVESDAPQSFAETNAVTSETEKQGS